MKLVVIKSKVHPLGILTRIFTGCFAYHVGFLDETAGVFYDVGAKGRRAIMWDSFYNPKYMQVEYFRAKVNVHYLKSMLQEKELYGFVDYFLFFFRWLGFNVKNMNGVICSEMVNRDLRRFGVPTPWNPSESPPSPCDILEWCKNGETKS